MKTVAMFGSARPGPAHPLYRETVEAARFLAENGWTIATGGGPGLMEAANIGAESTCKGGTCSLGYSIFLPFEAETNPAVQVDSHHRDFFTRLKQFTDDCDAFIALPGGVGTMLEILTVVQLLQVGHMKNKPLVLVGRMWEEIMRDVSRKMWLERYLSDNELSFWYCQPTPSAAAQFLVDFYNDQKTTFY